MRRVIAALSSFAIVTAFVHPGAAALISRALALGVALAMAIPLVRNGVRQVPNEPDRSPFLPARARAVENPLPAAVTWMADEMERSRTKSVNLSASLIARLRDVGAQRLATHHRLDVEAPDHVERICALASPALVAILQPGLHHTELTQLPLIPTAILPVLLSELEHL
jgi:hypothetical protein